MINPFDLYFIEWLNDKYRKIVVFTTYIYLPNRKWYFFDPTKNVKYKGIIIAAKTICYALVYYEMFYCLYVHI